MPLTGSLEGPDDPIPSYPPGYFETFPRDWADPAYEGAAYFEVTAGGQTPGWELHYKWAVVGNPGNHRYRLRIGRPVPPGEVLYTELYAETDDARFVQRRGAL